jgi:hypothetical protein
MDGKALKNLVFVLGFAAENAGLSAFPYSTPRLTIVGGHRIVGP